MKLYAYTQPPIKRAILMFWIRVVRLGLRQLRLKDVALYKMFKQELYNK